MTLMVHKVLDALHGRSDKLKVMNTGTPQEVLKYIRDGLLDAERFEFVNIPLEPDEEKGTWFWPKLTENERQYWVEGLVPLPAPVCWYEFVLGGWRSGLLVREDGDLYQVCRIDLVDDIVLIDGVLFTLLKSENHTLSNSGGWKMRVTGNDNLAARAVDNIGVPGNVASNAIFAIYLTLMLRSRSTDTAEEAAPVKLNKAREGRGLSPLFSHKIIDIVPSRYRQKTDGDGVGKPQRLHWRNSHLRHYDHQTPLAKWKGDETWNGQTGWFVVVIPRYQVGSKELGEITHEYRLSFEKVEKSK